MTGTGTPIRVLICEDQALVRAGYATIFGAQPDMAVVGEAADGVAAVQAARRLRPDVAVMDVRMPLLDGIEATRRLAGPGSADPVKVLVVTTFNVDEYVYQALKAGASGFLLKDAPAAELVNGVRTIARACPTPRSPPKWSSAARPSRPTCPASSPSWTCAIASKPSSWPTRPDWPAPPTADRAAPGHHDVPGRPR